MESVYNSVGLRNKAFPVLFVGIQGCDEREGNNPSWFNRIEASKVVEIIRKIRKTDCITSADIGVITPYRQQVQKLRKALESLEMEDVKVGSVEQFQGQEREIIIISTVRSTVKHNEFDRVYQLGFLSNHRRFNVAITRARSLLVIVGNPHIISKDRHWDKLLRYCAENGSYQGCLLPEPESHEYPEEEQFPGNADVVQYGPEQYPNQSQWNVETEHQSNLSEAYPKPYSAQYQNRGANPDCYKHTWNVHAPSYQPKGNFQTGQCSQQVDPVPDQADNPDWYKHTWNLDPDPLHPVPPQANNPDRYKHTCNIDTDPVDPVPPQADDPDWYKHTWNIDPDPVEPVPSQVDDPDWYQHTWNIDPDPVKPDQTAKPAEASVSEERISWSDLSEIKPTGWDD